jgi:two-component system OmpR family response regulator
VLSIIELEKTVLNNKILIIDDETDICFLLASMLKKKGFEVSFVNTLSDGLPQVSAIQPAVLFLDINLPDGSGLEFISKIKSLSLNTKIIMISAFDGLKERTTANERGADFFIGKPFNREVVCDAIDRVYIA